MSFEEQIKSKLGQMSAHIFGLNGGYYVYYPSNVVFFASHVTRLDQSRASKNINARPF